MEISVGVKSDFYVVIISTSVLLWVFFVQRPLKNLLTTPTQPHTYSTRGENNHNTLLFTGNSKAEILPLGKYCEGCNPVEEELSLIPPNFCSLYYFVHFSLWFLWETSFLKIKFLKLSVKQAIGMVFIFLRSILPEGA